MAKQHPSATTLHFIGVPKYIPEPHAETAELGARLYGGRDPCLAPQRGAELHSANRWEPLTRGTDSTSCRLQVAATAGRGCVRRTNRSGREPARTLDRNPWDVPTRCGWGLAHNAPQVVAARDDFDRCR